MASLEVTVEPAAALALAASVVVIDLAAIRWRKATISRWCRHQVRHRPALTLTVAAFLGLHLVLESKWDLAGWAAGWVAGLIDQGEA